MKQSESSCPAVGELTARGAYGRSGPPTPGCVLRRNLGTANPFLVVCFFLRLELLKSPRGSTRTRAQLDVRVVVEETTWRNKTCGIDKDDTAFVDDTCDARRIYAESCVVSFLFTKCVDPFVYRTVLSACCYVRHEFRKNVYVLGSRGRR